MLIRKDLLNNLLELAYLNAKSGEHWITVKPHGAESKGTHLLVKEGESNKEAVERKFDSKDKEDITKITLDEWMSKPRTFSKGKREITLNEFRARNKYDIPLGEHGMLRYPHGISKAERVRIEKRLQEKSINYEKSSKEYEKLKAEGKLPQIEETIEYKGRDEDRESVKAAARLYYKKSNKESQIQTELSDKTKLKQINYINVEKELPTLFKKSKEEAKDFNGAFVTEIKHLQGDKKAFYQEWVYSDGTKKLLDAKGRTIKKDYIIQ